ncbi:MAG TPA: aldo/keto reductase [Acidimicrobiales bacterium]|nr:aldo/keto reductase [Acidimicrobiales bacterium]
METRRLGVDGPLVSVVGLGCNNFGMRIDEAQTRSVVDAALEAGITHFDTAEMYGGGKSEAFLGEALGRRRDDVVIATKFSPRPKDDPYRPGDLRRRILEACEGSLSRLGTDRIDLYYQHYPDGDAPIEEALDTLTELVDQGKVLHIASSNVSADQIDEAAKSAEQRKTVAFCATQIEWSLLKRDVEKEVVPAARHHGLGIVPYFPLASGMLTGKYRKGEPFPDGSRLATGSYFASIATDENFQYVEALTAFAQARGHTLLELAVAWLAAQDGVASVIAGATTPQQVGDNARAAAWQLTADDLAALPSRPG